MLVNHSKLNYKDVSIVMISMNEEGAIKNVLQDISKDVPGAEIVLVDSSKDKTPQIAKKFKHLFHSTPRSQGQKEQIFKFYNRKLLWPYFQHEFHAGYEMSHVDSM